MMNGVATTQERPLVIQCRGQIWTVHLYGVSVMAVSVSPPSDMEMAVRLCALAAQELSAKHQIQKIDVQAPPDMAEKFRAIAKTRTLHLATRG